MRHKDIVEYLNPAEVLKKIGLLNPFNYKWKVGDGRLHTGFSAQEMYDVFPTIGKLDPDNGEYSIAYPTMTVVNTLGIQALKDRIEELEAQINTLKDNS